MSRHRIECTVNGEPCSVDVPARRLLSDFLRDDLHLHVLNVGEGLDRQVGQREQAEADQRGHKHQHEHALAQREDDQAIDHDRDPAPTSASSSSAPEVTTFSPGARPWLT